VLDDGQGMNETNLIEAMRAGSRSPLDARDPSDLGRFGLGLKTASFSQCRRLTVCSRAKGQKPATWRWDLDYVKDTQEWRLLESCEPGSEEFLSEIASLKHGTIVLWENLDRVVPEMDVDDESDHQHFLDLIEAVDEHVAMVFHRFLSPPISLHIFINGKADKNKVSPWDPFLENHPATQQLPAEPIRFHGATVTVRPFVLPHIDMLGPKMHDKAKGPNGWNSQQGFYIYRNKRLLVPGDWLGLGYTKEEHYKLARIQVDLSNSMDGDWNIDVKKSRARPPAPLRKRLRFIADEARKRAVEVYRHRGKQAARNKSESHVFAWTPERRKGKMVYVINRQHPLVARSLEVPDDFTPVVKALLRLLEETVPVQQIWLDTAEKPEGHGRPFETAVEKDVWAVMIEVYKALRQSGIDDAEAKSRIASMDAFTAHLHLISTLSLNNDES
jgi:hypothetical protein